MHLARLALLGLSTLAACYLGFLHFEGQESVPFIKHAGYWLVFSGLVLFLSTLCREARRIWYGGWRPGRRHLGPLAFVLGASLLLYLLQPAGYKIVMDEPVLAATALHMHEEKEVLKPTRTYEIGDEFVMLEGYVDKRRFLYPLLVSLLHDFAGYRALQGVVLNHLLAPVFLGLLFWVGRRLWPVWGGYAAVLLFLTVPLLAMNVNGGSFELLNLVMILVTGLAIERYLRRPDGDGLNLLVLSAVLLAHTRYESVLYVPVIGVVVLAGWWRERRPVVTWTAVLVPLFMVTIPLQQALLDQSPVLWQLGDETAGVFSFGRIPENLGHAAQHFLHAGRLQANSLLLSVLFLLSLPAGARLLASGRIRARFASPGGIAVLAVGLVVLVSFFLLMSYHWGQLNDAAVARIALPFILLQVVVVCQVAGACNRVRILGPAALILTSGFFLAVTRPTCASTDFLYNAWPSRMAEWLRQAEALPEKCLFITDASSVALAERRPALPEEYAAQHKAELEFHRKLGTFGEILFVTRAVPDPDEPGRKRTVSPLDRDFEMEVLREEKLTKQYYVRVARMTGVRWRPWDRRQLEAGTVAGALSRDEALELFAETLP
jgi:hypothetical protein